MQLSEKTIFIQGVIGETGLERRISSLTVPWVAYSIFEARSAALRRGHCGRSPEEGRMMNDWDILSVSKYVQGYYGKKIFGLFFLFFFSIMISDSRTHTKQWKVGEIYLRWIWRALHLFKERSRILSRITLLPLGVCSRHRGRGPALGACGGRITLKETEIPSHLQKSGLFLFVSDS